MKSTGTLSSNELQYMPRARPTNGISNSINFECCSLKYVQPITKKFCTRHGSVTVVTYAKCCRDR